MYDVSIDKLILSVSLCAKLDKEYIDHVYNLLHFVVKELKARAGIYI